MTHTLNNRTQRTRRHKRVRAKVQGTAKVPRLSVFRSNRYVYAQIIDDVAGRTLAGVHSASFVSSKKDAKETKTERAKKIGTQIAERAKELRIVHVVFDRGGYRYQGRVRSLADGAREGGLEF